MTVDEKVNQDIFFVLQKIQKEILLGKAINNEVTYNLSLFPKHKDQPTAVDEQTIIDLLVKNGVIEKIVSTEDFAVEGEEDGNPKYAGISYHIVINRLIFEKYYKKHSPTATSPTTNKLLISKDGDITFYSSTGDVYKCKLGTKTNAYSVLRTLCTDPSRVFSFSELAANFKKGSISNSPEERQVRDAVGTIKAKLQYKGNDLFMTNHGFGLKCGVEFIK